MFIGEVLDVKVDESIIDGDRGPDIWRIKPIFCWPRWGSSEYYSIGTKFGQAYAQKKKPEK